MAEALNSVKALIKDLDHKEHDTEFDCMDESPENLSNSSDSPEKPYIKTHPAYKFDQLGAIDEESEDEDPREKQESEISQVILTDSQIENQITKSSLEAFSQTEEYRNLKQKMNSALWEFVVQNDDKSVKTVLDIEKYGAFTADPNAKGLNDWTALHTASAYGYKEIARILIQSSAEMNARTSILRTPLHLATLHNHFRVLKLLIKAGADINLKDNEDNTALHYASSQGYHEIVEWLLRKNPVFDLNKNGRSPFCLALNHETHSIFVEYSKSRELKMPVTGFTRTVISGTLRHNSREDYVNSLTWKCSQKINVHDLKAFNERPKFEFNTKKQKKNTEKFVLPPSKVGPYDFKGIAQLGRGSFGEVYLVEKTDSGEQYALKVLKKEKVLGNNLVRYAFTERNILLHITHPFIVKLHFAFQTQEKLIMVMDFCPNGDLGTHLTREKKFSEEKARLYMAEITLALGELHRNGILFRDLKPENVVLDKDGHAKLTDFGLSKEGVSDEQLSKSFCGSIAYLAPEMLKRSGHTRSVDWYLLGVLSYEMVCGSPPFYSPNREQMFSNIQKAELRFPQFLSSECKSLIKELMNRDVHKRLGAGKRDMEEIKEHPFFKDVDWNAIYSREIPPPPIKPVRRAPKVVSLEKMFGKLENEVTQKVDGWSVLQPSKRS